MKNILITSAGKRVTLVEIFKKTLKSYDSGAMVYTTDMNPLLAPAGIISDKCFKVPRVTSPDYISILLSICTDYNIGMVIPTIDTELLVLSENKDLFSQKGISLIVSDFDFIRLCRDKRNTGDYLQKLGIRVPAPVDKYNPTFPLFAKPYDGSLSKDLHVIKNVDELTPDIMCNPKLIFMEYIDKSEYREFTVDMYYGRDNHVKSIVPRERLEIRAGEINKGYTRKNFLVGYLKGRMDYLPGVVGCICIQLFYRESDNDVVGIEINPRFGGGYPLSYYAKADFPKYLIHEYFLDKPMAYFDEWLDNTLMLRYDSEVIVYEEKGTCL
ncbi:ATP-grasp domain-containing protein [uncultured Bacteroides sp.]|uniref:ATP-grasp domain-containing protein n=1 Tax=uncultured Bacteroides sp. TaxID=162156 RepID=UPI002604E56E|nr:ATP-grasp domain-containing protein [uncultured Bacteroides sp.]